MLKELKCFSIRIFGNSFISFILFSIQCFIAIFAEPNGPISTDPGHPFS